MTQCEEFTGPQVIFYADGVEIREFYDTPGVFTSRADLERKEFQIFGACQAIIDETEHAVFLNSDGNVI